MLLRHGQLGNLAFLQNIFFKILVSERKYKNNLKNLESEKNIFCNSHINVCVCFTKKSRGFAEILKVKI